MEVKPGYKQTEIGVIPEDWIVSTLGEAAKVITGRTPPTNDPSNYGHEHLFVGPADLGSNKYIVKSEKSLSQKGFNKAVHIPKNSIMVTCIGSTIGKVGISGDLLSTNQQINSLIAAPAYDMEYLYYTVLHNAAGIKSAASEQAVPIINKSYFSRIKAAFAPTKEQQEIVIPLKDIDYLITSLEKLIEKKINIKQGVMQELITGKRRLPGYSEVWKTTNLGELVSNRLVSLGRGSVISKKSIDTFKGDYPIYSSSIHNNGLFGCWDNYVFDEELITWSVDGGGNFFHRKKHRYSVTNVCGYMRVDQTRICYGFLYYQLTLAHSALEFDYTIKAHPSVIKKLYNVLLPTLTEQKAIYEFLNDIDDEINTLCNGLTKYKHLKQGMMQELLTGRIRLI